MEFPGTTEVAAEILEPLQLRFSDLILLSSASRSDPPTLSFAELSRVESLTAAVMQALGPSGPGLLAVTGVPRAPDLRRALLPLARNLALLNCKDLARVFKEHGLGSDVPLKSMDRNVSSFTLQLKYTPDLFPVASSANPKSAEEKNHAEGDPVLDSSADTFDTEFKDLGRTCKELVLCMIELGLHLSQVCDKVLDCTELEQSIKDGSAKGRLVHYHSVDDNIVLKQINGRKKGSKKKVLPATLSRSPSNACTASEDFPTKSGKEILHDHISSAQYYAESRISQEAISRATLSHLWQQWHYDYGIFTVLTSPSFMISCKAKGCSHISCCQDCSSPDEHTYLQLFDMKNNKIYVVRSPADSIILQVGEAAEILTRGKLQSKLHSVGRPFGIDSLSRETFVVFLQPAWSKVLSYSGYSFYDESRNLDDSVAIDDMFHEKCDGSVPDDANKLMLEILKKIPPLSTRYRNGMTFADFSHETTKQYYSRSGMQSTR